MAPILRSRSAMDKKLLHDRIEDLMDKLERFHFDRPKVCARIQALRHDLAEGMDPAHGMHEAEDRVQDVVLQLDRISDGTHDCFRTPSIKVEKAAGLKCGICFDDIDTNARIVGSSNCVEMAGLKLSPCQHAYCHDCLLQFISIAVNERAQAFPLKCPQPECETIVSPENEDVCTLLSKTEILTKFMMLHVQATEMFLYCTNKECSELNVLDATEMQAPGFPQCMCVSCNELSCYECKVPWHLGLTCKQYQAIPQEDRSGADLDMIRLANSKNWRNCPSCQVVIERVLGCNHVLCKCGMGFCYKCGLAYKSHVQTAHNVHGVPACKCELFDDPYQPEEPAANPVMPQPVNYNLPVAGVNLPEWIHDYVQERVRQYLLQPRFAGLVVDPDDEPEVVPHRPAAARPAIPANSGLIGLKRKYADFLAGKINLPQWFQNCLREKKCRQCDRVFPTVQALDKHITNTSQHETYYCCNRLFKNRHNYNSHVQRLH